MYQVLNTENIKSFMESFDTLLLDCDGVIWLDKIIIQGVPETLEWLKSVGKNFFFVTNNSTKSRATYKKKLESFGIKCSIDDIWTSSFAAAKYLESKKFNKKVYIIGMSGIAEELDLIGIPHCNYDMHNEKGLSGALEDFKFELDPSIGAVVVGLDLKINYSKVAYSLLHLRKNPDCELIATNDDNAYPFGEDMLLPGAGSIVKMVEYCSKMKATVVGKPCQWFLEEIVNASKLNKSRTIMVGDKLSTDILFGNSGNMRTLLVLTGITKLNMLDDPELNEGIIPTYVADSLSHLKKYYK